MFLRLTFRHVMLLGLVLLLGVGLAGCGDDELPEQILGKWEITDPGGALIGGTVEFRVHGWVTIVESLRQRGRIRQTILSGSYEFTDRDTIRMELSGPDGKKVERDVGIGVREGWLTLHFRRGQIVYRRIG